MEQGKVVVDEDMLLISKHEFMKVVSETIREVENTEADSVDEIIDKIITVRSLAMFSSILTYNLFDGD